MACRLRGRHTCVRCALAYRQQRATFLAGAPSDLSVVGTV